MLSTLPACSPCRLCYRTGMLKHAIADCRLYGFIDTAFLAGRNPGELTRQLIAGGVDIIQVRAKNEKPARRLPLALAVTRAAEDSPVPIIINDDIEAAYGSRADGVHLGQEDWFDLPTADRHQRLLGLEILGLSTHSLPQAIAAQGEGANYIGVGPVFATGTKPDAKPVGLELVRQVAGRVATPFFAIGGITLENLDTVLAAGATRVAVVSAILNAPDVTAAAKMFKKRLSA